MKTNTNKQKLIVLCECAIFIALSTVLSIFAKVWESPLGGSVTILSMLPVMFISIRHGLQWGFGSAFVYSVIQLIDGFDSIAYIPTAGGIVCSILFDYIVPFTILGIAGIFVKRDCTNAKKEYLSILFGILLAIALRFICHYLVGALLWYEITKEGQWNDYVNKYGPWLYSLIYQSLYLVPDGLLVVLASPIIPRLYKIRLTK